MHNKLIAYINTKVSTPLKVEEVDILQTCFIPQEVQKNHFFLQAGEISRQLGFVMQGALKQYTIREDGKEQIIGLFIEDWWVGDRESFSQNTPSPYFVQAIEPTTLLICSKEQMENELNHLPFMIELHRVLTDRHTYQLLRRLQAANSFSAEQRLAELEKKYPEFMDRFPQHIIASYLGMTKETLSRIRNSKN